MVAEPLVKTYDPAGVEAKWSAFWLERRFFHAEEKAEQKKPFSMVIPPPNVTGSLHMGHALNVTLQDIVARFWRMRGYNTCWIPGTDHAGIATQNVVERQLKSEGVDRHQLGREAFVERVWQWKKEYGDRITHQLRRLGASCDWERERFTMDEGLSRAVREVFIHLFNDGLIYRGEYLINWCPRCHTALSDLEVEHEEVAGHLWHIQYPGIVVATTRPETMLGDTAVAVHPDDERYAGLVGTTVRLPLTDRAIPIIADHRVDRAFGTGAVKVTPAHDLNDFHLGNDHRLPRINIFTPEAKVNEQGGSFQGMDRYDARREVVKALDAQGALVKVEDYRHNVGHCYRCKTVVEPYLSKQWFVKVAPLADKAAAAVRQGQTKFIPAHWAVTYFDWMERIQDWCISRQIWWGHRIPAWYCEGGCEPVVGREAPARCAGCGTTTFTQDPDVLDTWFSSALWPFSTLGWPDHTVAIKTFYPTTVLITGFDIIFFWVARMMMMGLRFMGDVPFKTVYITPLVRDPLGQKMSKSKGNVIDPLEIMDQYGTDALRFTLAALSVQGRDIKLSPSLIAGHRNFCNKLWNAARFLALQCAGDEPEAQETPQDAAALSLPDKWISHRLHRVVREATKAIEAYAFDQAARLLYQFVWHEFCDWYLEAAKLRLSPERAAQVEGLRPKVDPAHRQATAKTLKTTFETILRLLHPFMPFLTEELWQQLPVSARVAAEGAHPPPSIAVAQWPVAAPRPVYAKEAKTFQLIAEVVSAIRTIRSEHQVPPAKRMIAVLRTEDPLAQKVLGTHGTYLRELARLERLEVRITPVREGPHAVAIAGPVEVYVPLAGLIDVETERVRLQKAIDRIAQVAGQVESKLADAAFVKRAPAEVVAEERERQVQMEAELAKLRAVLARLAPPAAVNA